MRSIIGLTAIVGGGMYLSDGGTLKVEAWTVSLLFISAGAALLVGFLTPAASTLLALNNLTILISWLRPPHWAFLNSRMALIEAFVICIAIALLGPGAFSVDARLFGRREISIPKPSHPTRS